MNRNESAQIEIVRVFCILSMMWVHVSPGLGHPSTVNGGSFDFVGNVLGQTLGHISVTTLSFISGYLFWNYGAGTSFTGFARHRFTSIMVPMLVWSAVFILLAVGKEVLIGHASSAIRSLGLTNPDILNAWTGIAGRTANRSLFFLRDLFVATLIVRAVAPFVRMVPVIPIALALVITILNCSEPVIFRPIILLFMLLGATAARRGVTITKLSQPKLSLPAGIVLALIGQLDPQMIPVDSMAALRALDLLRRLGAGFIILTMVAAAVEVLPMAQIARLGRHSYLAFLIHVPLVGVFWVVWTAIIGDENQLSYLFFFVAAPFLVFAIAAKLGRTLDHSPRLLQVLLRGKAMQGDRPRLVEKPAQ